MSDDGSTRGPDEADLDAWFAYKAGEDDAGTRSKPLRTRPDRPGWLGLVALGLLLLTLIGLVALWPTGERQDQYRDELDAIGIPTDLFAARVDSVLAEPCQFDAAATCITVGFELLQGPNEGEIFSQTFTGLATTPTFRVGEEEILSFIPDADQFEFQYQFQDRQRRGVLLWVAAAFAVAVIALGRWRGVAALAGLVASIAVLIAFVLPAILDGRNPVLVAVVAAALIAYVALYLAHGFTRMTTVALIGMLVSLALVAVLSSLVLAVARISGFATEEAVLLSLFEGIDIRGLVLAGTVLGAAGALDDVTVTQASAVWELRAANPAIDSAGLFRAGIRIGRDHIASTVNTLMLAYAGAALPLFVLFLLSEQSLGAIANSEVVAIEILRTLIGSIGLVAAVPLTTWLAATFAPRSALRRGSQPS